jgi:hypothetical protein
MNRKNASSPKLKAQPLKDSELDGLPPKETTIIGTEWVRANRSAVAQ